MCNDQFTKSLMWLSTTRDGEYPEPLLAAARVISILFAADDTAYAVSEDLYNEWSGYRGDANAAQRQINHSLAAVDAASRHAHAVLLTSPSPVYVGGTRRHPLSRIVPVTAVPRADDGGVFFHVGGDPCVSGRRLAARCRTPRLRRTDVEAMMANIRSADRAAEIRRTVYA